jgi:hypothetical protein
LIARLHVTETPGNPCRFIDPSYNFRRVRTNAHHGQGFTQEPEDEEWL